MELRFWRPVMRPPQDHVPAHIRKIWLARDCFASQETAHASVAAQKVVFASEEALVLRGRDYIRTRPHAAFSNEGLVSCEQQILLWVPFSLHFSEPPIVKVELVRKHLPYSVKAVQIEQDGFQVLLSHRIEFPESGLEAVWKAAGFPAASKIQDTGI